MRVLIAEDEVGIAKALKILLERNRFSVDILHNGTEALDYLLGAEYDVAVLDIMMPGLSGLEVLQRIRAAGCGVPVLFLTARSELEDRILGLNSGADDYLAKPFEPSEFVARVKALSRRSGSYAPSVLFLGGTRLDCNRYELCTADGCQRLNNKEFQMMELFMRYPHHVFSAEHLMSSIWGLDSDSEIDVVWTYIGFLRKKMKLLEADIEIRTVRGAGYSLEEKTC